LVTKRDMIDILIQSGRGGWIDCPSCQNKHYQGPTKLRAARGVCDSCRPKPPKPPKIEKPPKPPKPKKKKRGKRTSIPTSVKRQLPRFCWLCGSAESLHTHHKNRDASDHRLENLVVLCETCHCSVHFNEPVFKAMVKRWFGNNS
jgi:hypothetical protein